jgi:hypothetical protein
MIAHGVVAELEKANRNRRFAGVTVGSLTRSCAIRLKPDW